MQNFDAIVCPVEPYAALPHGDVFNLTAADAGIGWGFMNFYNLTGWPAGVVRAGITIDGLPLGVQIVARPGEDYLALDIMGQIEERLGGFVPPKL